jgi:hypothetical protein
LDGRSQSVQSLSPGVNIAGASSTWLRHRGIGADGVVLVRPDRFVAWRSLAGSEDPRSELATALGQILGRSLEARVPVGASAV